MSGAFNDGNGDRLSIYALTKSYWRKNKVNLLINQFSCLYNIYIPNPRKISPDHQVNANLKFQR